MKIVWTKSIDPELVQDFLINSRKFLSKLELSRIVATFVGLESWMNFEKMYLDQNLTLHLETNVFRFTDLMTGRFLNEENYEKLFGRSLNPRSSNSIERATLTSMNLY